MNARLLAATEAQLAERGSERPTDCQRRQGKSSLYGPFHWITSGAVRSARAAAMRRAHTPGRHNSIERAGESTGRMTALGGECRPPRELVARACFDVCVGRGEKS